MPSTSFATPFFTVLALVADGIVGAAVLVGIGMLASERLRRSVVAGIAHSGPLAFPAALLVAVVTTTGSLYYSEHAGYLPCELCWYQRIVMYPLVVVLAVGCLRRARGAWVTAAPFVVIGAPLSLYHWLVERVPSLAEGQSCSLLAPCSVPYFERLGFVTLAWMCLSAFLLIGVLLVVAAVAERARPSAGAAASSATMGTPHDRSTDPAGARTGAGHPVDERTPR